MASKGISRPDSIHNIPRPPPFSDVKFSTIGQDPSLLKRISAPNPGLANYNHHSSPPPDLHYPSHTGSPLPSSRPTLFQALTFSQRPDLVVSDTSPQNQTSSVITQTEPTFRQRLQASSPLSHESVPMISSHELRTIPQNPVPTHDSPSLHGEASASLTRGQSGTPSIISQPVVPSSVVIRPSAPTVATNPQKHSSYADLRALQTRLVSYLSNLHPPDMTNTLLRVQMANAQTANALTTAHRSHILAQQSLAASREAVAAAQESLRASEQAQTHVNDAFVAVKQLTSAQEGTDTDGNPNSQWQVNFTQLQEDLRLFGDWIREKEHKEAARRQDTYRLEAHVQHNNQVEASELYQGARRANSAEAPRAVATSETEMAIEDFTGPLLGNISSPQGIGLAQIEAERATKARGLEIPITNHKVPVDVDTVPMAIDVDLAKHLPPDTSRDSPSLLQSFRDQPPENLEESPVQHSQGIQHAREEKARLQAQLEERTRALELQAQKLEVARFQMMQRQLEESSENTLDGSRTKLQHAPSNGKFADQQQQTRLQGSAIVEAKRALQAHKDRELSAEQLAQKKAETRRLLGERKQRELAELKKREEEEKAAELERIAIAKEQELIAEQGRRRQEVMALKQRVSAETAARINAERARETQKSSVVSLHLTSAISQQPVTTKKEDANDARKKTKSLSGGIKSGPVAPEPVPESLPPPPSAQLGLRALKVQPTNVDDTFLPPKLNGHDSNTANVAGQSSQNPTQRALTPIVNRNATENLLADRDSEDADNLYIDPRSQVLPTSLKAQAVDLPFIKDRRSNGWGTPHPPDMKYNPPTAIHLPMGEEISIKQESPVPEARKSSANSRERDNVESRSLHTIPTVILESASPLPTAENHIIPKPTQIIVSADRSRDNTEFSPIAPSTTIVEIIKPVSSIADVHPINLKHPDPSTASSNNPHRDNSSLPRINSRPPPLGPSGAHFPISPNPDTTSTDLNIYNNSSQIAPIIQSNDRWDQAADEESYSYRARSPSRPHHREIDHYSPSSRSTSPSSVSPRLPILGKRRYHEQLREEPPARRQRYGGRSPPRGPSRWRRPSPDRPNLQTRMQINNYDTPRSRSSGSRELVWRSPSPDHPALQARTYHSGTYNRPQPRNQDDSELEHLWYPPTQNRSGSEHSESLPHGPSHRRRANQSSISRSAPRGRAGRGGSRTLNLEQRISSYNEPSTLMNRLRSPPTRTY